MRIFGRSLHYAQDVQGNASTFAQASPLAQAERISIIDSLRGVALLGILMMNIPFFGLPEIAAESLDVFNEYSGPNYYTWWVVNGLFEGTMRALFSMLFGAGSLLLLSRLEKKYTGTFPADIFYRRLLWLLIFGLINAFIFLWAGDILYTYALCGLFIFPFRNLKARHLLFIGLVLLVIASFKSTLKMYEKRDERVKGEQAIALANANRPLSAEQQQAKENWEAQLKKGNKSAEMEAVNKEIQEVRKGYFSVMKYYTRLNVKFQSTVFYHLFFWDAICFFFIGMAFFKWGILTGQKSKTFYIVISVLGYIPGLILTYLMLHTQLKHSFDDSRMADALLFDFYQFKRLFMTLGHIGFLMTIYKLNMLKWFFRLMAGVGQMAFSNYLMQSLICGFIFFGHGLGKFGSLQRYELYIVVAGVWVFQIIFSNLWLRYFRFGPFEWVWRSLTYWQKQPMRRNNPAKLETV